MFIFFVSFYLFILPFVVASIEACATGLEQNSLWSKVTDKPDPFLVNNFFLI